MLFISNFFDMLKVMGVCSDARMDTRLPRITDLYADFRYYIMQYTVRPRFPDRVVSLKCVRILKHADY